MTRYFEIRPQLKKYFANEGTFIDPRDGNTYKTVEINGQVWLAENLRFEGVKHFAPDGNENNIAKYGCLYEWEGAMEACPDGWHLPSKEDFEELLNVAGSSPSANLCAQSWGKGWRGNDSLGFKALPAGYYFDGDYYDFGFYALFWSATESEDFSYRACRLRLGNGSAYVYRNSKDYAFSVRCIKD